MTTQVGNLNLFSVSFGQSLAEEQHVLSLKGLKDVSKTYRIQV